MQEKSTTLKSNIRNFCIIAHIDHGKSTLADRLLEFTNTIDKRMMREQVLDRMDLERERGITIKAKAVTMNYTAKDGKPYILNLIDTPGHVDFNYEVSKSLSACEGALLVIDAVSGIEAQTLANVHLAIAQDLVIIPVINKIDLQAADPERVKIEIEEVIGIDSSMSILASAKEGIGTQDILEAIIERVPFPSVNVDSPLRALIFDSVYDSYKGVIAFVRVVDGAVKKDTQITLMESLKTFEVMDVGIFKPGMVSTDSLKAGEVGYIVAGVKSVSDIKVGDTITDTTNAASTPLPGYKEVKPFVFCGFHPVETGEFELLRTALEKLKLSDASLVFEPESSEGLGPGYRCGFLGLLHMEIIQERLEREYNLNLIATSPSVVYRILKTNKDIIEIDNPVKLPSLAEVEGIAEPFVKAYIITPSDYIGVVMELSQDKRGVYVNTEYLSPKRAVLTYELPLGEIIFDFFDKLKSITQGYASLDYEFLEYRISEIVKLDILVAGERVDALSIMVHEDKAYYKGRQVVAKLKEVIPKQLFEVSIQASIGSRIIARETIPQLRKDVIAKLYGGDVTRKKKLLEKQKEGKKRMKHIGKIDLPQEAFLAILKVD